MLEREREKKSLRGEPGVLSSLPPFFHLPATLFSSFHPWSCCCVAAPVRIPLYYEGAEWSSGWVGGGREPSSSDSPKLRSKKRGSRKKKGREGGMLTSISQQRRRREGRRCPLFFPFFFFLFPDPPLLLLSSPLRQPDDIGTAETLS